ncbi:SoxR reducing system RseC family protein [Amphritea balenae]|uniref:Transcriptional regulator n=1 Tax=Amphritea balenae TaxID=452629 RepID=A0A3P1SMX9_9GAMM|nr:SoxR reducing system RseC family protein [Amphritea balenae]RRC98390.1 transcriptional regulator [Amphritea balenae]GGK81515.1 positive regulator for alginate biosynthesis MucC [Amphritea balenae]
MIEESGRVVRLESETVWVETIKQSACAGCSAQKGCGQSLLAKIGDGKRLEIQVDNPDQIAVSVDDQVLLGVGERSFLTASLLVYLLPVVAMFIAALMVQIAGFAEPLVIVAAVLGLIGGFLLTRIISNSMTAHCSYRPVLLQKLN